MAIDNTSNSRREALKVGLAMIGVGAAGLTARTVRAQEKLAQNLVQYQETPKEGAECDKCVNFQPPNACTIVTGNINPKGWCVAYAPKES